MRGGNLQEGYKRIQSLVSRLCLRRTKSDMIDGQPIISIAPAHQVCRKKKLFYRKKKV